MVFFALAAVAGYLAPQAVLTAVGFTGAGIGAGSIAAAVQGVVYGGATAGGFSALQAAGAAGAGMAVKAAGAAAAAGAYEQYRYNSKYIPFKTQIFNFFYNKSIKARNHNEETLKKICFAFDLPDKINLP